MHCWYAPAGLLWSGLTGSPPLARLHREALKQAATDPKTGIIDIGILTTGVCWFVGSSAPLAQGHVVSCLVHMQVSSSERLRRSALAKEIKRILSAKGKQQSTFHHDTLLEEVRTASDAVSSFTIVPCPGEC